MKRRSLLQALTTASASSLLRTQQPVVSPKPSAAGIEEIPVIEATIPDLAGAMVPSFFTEVQFQALRRLSDLIVPAINDVPGALAAHAPEFLDFLVDQSPEKRQTLYRHGLNELNSRAERQFNVPFAAASQVQADVILAPLRAQWSEHRDQFTAFLCTAKADILQATQNSEDWIRLMSKRVRSAGGLGTYWFPIN